MFSIASFYQVCFTHPLDSNSSWQMLTLRIGRTRSESKGDRRVAAGPSVSNVHSLHSSRGERQIWARRHQLDVQLGAMHMTLAQS